MFGIGVVFPDSYTQLYAHFSTMMNKIVVFIFHFFDHLLCDHIPEIIVVFVTKHPGSTKCSQENGAVNLPSAIRLYTRSLSLPSHEAKDVEERKQLRHFIVKYDS